MFAHFGGPNLVVPGLRVVAEVDGPSPSETALGVPLGVPLSSKPFAFPSLSRHSRLLRIAPPCRLSLGPLRVLPTSFCQCPPGQDTPARGPVECRVRNLAVVLIVELDALPFNLALYLDLSVFGFNLELKIPGYQRANSITLSRIEVAKNLDGAIVSKCLELVIPWSNAALLASKRLYKIKQERVDRAVVEGKGIIGVRSECAS